MSVETSFARIETEISDYRSSSKKKEQDMFGKLVKNLSEDRMEIELLTFKGLLTVLPRLVAQIN